MNCSAGAELLEADAALARLLAAAEPLSDTERVPLAAAHGRVLARPLVSLIDVPGHDNSSMDGYALRLADLAGGRTLPVSQVIAAGAAPSALAAGHAARIFTGAPVPAGADAVVMQEQCETADGRVTLPDGIQPGQNIRRAGEDVARGSMVLAPGRRLRPQELGLAAAVGAAELEVIRRLKVAVVTTGDELAPPGQPLAPGQIHDSNTSTLVGLLTRLGCECLPPLRLPDEATATREGLSRAAAAADVIVSTGGVSVGEEDHVKAAVSALGALDLWRVAIRPGKPFAFGRVGATPFIGLPGNPVSVFVTCLILARPFLLKRQGCMHWEVPALPVVAGFDWSRPDRRRRDYVRARLVTRNGAWVAEIHPHQGSGVLSSCAWADGLVRLEPGQSVREGDVVPYLSFNDLT